MIIEKKYLPQETGKRKRKRKIDIKRREKGKEKEHTDRGTDRQAGMWPLNRSHPTNQHPRTVNVKTGVIY